MLLELAGITVLFFLFLVIKNLFFQEKKICVLCIAVGVSWITLLILYSQTQYTNPLLVALLMGQSVLGIFYLVEHKVKEELTLFRLPFLLTLTIFGYTVLSRSTDLFLSIIFLVVLWFVFGLVYYYRNNSHFQNSVKKLIECCKRW